MALKFRHINTQQTLNTIKFSADSTNATYFLHSSTSTQLQGTPDVNYEDICFIKPTGQVYTHGKLYNSENNNNYADEYLDYLHKLCTGNNKNAIILSGGEKYENGIKKAFVYINNVGIKSLPEIYSGSFTINTDYKIILYTISNAYFFEPSTYNLKDNDELVCDWADLARLSDLEVPVATNYQNGLITANEKELLQGLNNYSSFAVTYGNDKYCQFYKNGAIIFIRGFLDVSKSVVINNVNTKYLGLIPCSSKDEGYTYNSSGAGTITFTAKAVWGTLFVLARYYDAINVEQSDITIIDA